QIEDDLEMTGVGEYTIHGWIADSLVRPAPGAANVVLGVGDDAAVLSVAADEQIVASTDSVPPGLLRSTSAAAAAYAARFAVVSSLSDVLAMGADPVAILVNLHLERSTPASWAATLLREIGNEAANYGASVVGGDLKERDWRALTITAL